MATKQIFVATLITNYGVAYQVEAEGDNLAEAAGKISVSVPASLGGDGNVKPNLVAPSSVPRGH